MNRERRNALVVTVDSAVRRVWPELRGQFERGCAWPDATLTDAIARAADEHLAEQRDRPFADLTDHEVEVVLVALESDEENWRSPEDQEECRRLRGLADEEVYRRPALAAKYEAVGDS